MAYKLQLDGERILMDGKEVGHHEFDGRRSKVVLSFSYETEAAEWIVPLSHLATGLGLLPEVQVQPLELVLEIETDEEDVEVLDGVIRRLDEKTIKGSGYKWRFHKNDADDFPSPLHGHDYERGLKIDAITGRIYDVSTKNHCETLRSKGLRDVQSKLRASRDFKDKVETLIGPA